MGAVNTDDRPKNSVKQMRKISKVFVLVPFSRENVSMAFLLNRAELSMNSGNLRNQ